MLKTKTARLIKTEPANEAPVREPKPKRIGKGGKVVQERDQYFSRAVAKALEVLEFLQAELTPKTMNEVTQRTQLSKSSAFRLLHTLETIGYVTVDGRGQYKLASGIYSATPTQWLSKLLRVGMPHLQSLSRELGETVSLAALFDNRIEVIAVVESSHVIRMSNVVGHILPPNASSLGKVITAFQSLEQRKKLLRSFGIYLFTKYTITDQKDLNREYDTVREQQFAIDREECAYDGICFSVPIFSANGQVSAAISTSIPKIRVRDAGHEREIIAAARATAEQLALDLQKA